MDKNAATYYRTLVFSNGQDTRALPPELVKLHEWTLSRQQLLGLGGQVSKTTALHIVMTWAATCASAEQFVANQPLLRAVWPPDEDKVEWETVQTGTAVEIVSDDGATAAVFMNVAPRRKGHVVVQVNGNPQTLKAENIRLVT